MNELPYLTDAEIAMICDPLMQQGAQVRYLRKLGLSVQTKPNGRPLVGRAHFEQVISGRADNTTQKNPQVEPDIAALERLFQGRRGTQKKKQSA